MLRAVLTDFGPARRSETRKTDYSAAGVHDITMLLEAEPMKFRRDGEGSKGRHRGQGKDDEGP